MVALSSKLVYCRSRDLLNNTHWRMYSLITSVNELWHAETELCTKRSVTLVREFETSAVMASLATHTNSSVYHIWNSPVGEALRFK